MIGPFSLAGATPTTQPDGAWNYTQPGMQVVALLCSHLPVLPPADAPDVPQANAAASGASERCDDSRELLALGRFDGRRNRERGQCAGHERWRRSEQRGCNSGHELLSIAQSDSRRGREPGQRAGHERRRRHERRVQRRNNRRELLALGRFDGRRNRERGQCAGHERRRRNEWRGQRRKLLALIQCDRRFRRQRGQRRNSEHGDAAGVTPRGWAHLEEAMTDPNDTAAATSSSLDSSYFTDGDQLTAMLVDKRATDTKQRSSFVDAQAIVSAFAAETNPGAWSATLSRADVANRLTQMVTVPDPTLKDPQPTSGPRSLQQGALNLCGPTAFFQMALGRDPVAVMRLATQLFDNGSATLGCSLP